MTDHRAANEQLRAIEARKSAILDGALDGIMTMDHEGKVVDFNPAAEAMFGIARAEIVGQPMAPCWRNGSKCPRFTRTGMSS